MFVERDVLVICMKDAGGEIPPSSLILHMPTKSRPIPRR
jgi:hypothetical protein